MRVLTVFAHHGSGSFCHAVLRRFDAGLRDAGHTNDIVDLYAVKFDPVLRDRDDPNWMDADAPDEVLARMHLRERILQNAGGPLKRFAALIIQTTIFDERAYDAGLRQAMHVLVDEFALDIPGSNGSSASSSTPCTTATRPNCGGIWTGPMRWDGSSSRGSVSCRHSASRH